MFNLVNSVISTTNRKPKYSLVRLIRLSFIKLTEFIGWLGLEKRFFQLKGHTFYNGHSSLLHHPERGPYHEMPLTQGDGIL